VRLKYIVFDKKTTILSIPTLNWFSLVHYIRLQVPVDQWFSTWGVREPPGDHGKISRDTWITAYLRYGRICHILPPVINRLIVSLLGLTECECGVCL